MVTWSCSSGILLDTGVDCARRPPQRWLGKWKTGDSKGPASALGRTVYTEQLRICSTFSSTDTACHCPNGRDDIWDVCAYHTYKGQPGTVIHCMQGKGRKTVTEKTPQLRSQPCSSIESTTIDHIVSFETLQCFCKPHEHPRSFYTPTLIRLTFKFA